MGMRLTGQTAVVTGGRNSTGELVMGPSTSRGRPGRAVIEELARDGMTMIVVTHEMGFAKIAADRVVMMDGGVVIEEGPPEHFFEAPEHERTKQFLSKIL